MLEEKGKAAKDPNVCAKDKPILRPRSSWSIPKTKGVAYAFAYISRPKGANPDAIKELLAKQPKVELDQKNCEFMPYVLPMHQGQTLIVKASDPGINHNVRHEPRSTNPGLNQNVAGGDRVEAQARRRETADCKCDIHPWMKAYVMVFDHPFFATTGKDGSFEIKGVPAGTQNLVLWQEGRLRQPGAGRGMPVDGQGGRGDGRRRGRADRQELGLPASRKGLMSRNRRRPVRGPGLQARDARSRYGRQPEPPPISPHEPPKFRLPGPSYLRLDPQSSGYFVAKRRDRTRSSRRKARPPAPTQEKPVVLSWHYRVGRLLQFVGLIVLPFGIASELMGKVGLGQSLLIAGGGALAFYAGYVIQNRS